MQTDERPVRQSDEEAAPAPAGHTRLFGAEGVHLPRRLHLDSVEQWKEFLCLPTQTLIHFASGQCSLVVDVRGDSEESPGIIVVLGDAGLSETGTLDASNLLHANAEEDIADFLIRGFVGGRFTSSRRSVRVVSLESDGKGHISHVTSEVTSAESSSTSATRIRRTIHTFIKEFIFEGQDHGGNPEAASGSTTTSMRSEAPSSATRGKTGGKKSVTTKTSFDLSQLGALRQALSILGVLRKGRKSIPWPAMETILATAFDEEGGLDERKMAKLSTSLNKALKSNEDCWRRIRQLAPEEGYEVLISPEEVGLAMQSAFKPKPSPKSKKSRESRLVSFSLPPRSSPPRATSTSS